MTYDDLGTPTISGDTTNRLTWKGLSYDEDLMLTHVRARWYDPMVGRFVSEDPIGLSGGINPYVFAGNDPIDGSDPSGEHSGYRYDECNPGTSEELILDLDAGTVTSMCVGGAGFGVIVKGMGFDGPSTGVPSYADVDARRVRRRRRS